MSTSSSPLLSDAKNPIKQQDKLAMDAQNENETDVESQKINNQNNQSSEQKEEKEEEERSPLISIAISVIITAICFGISYPTNTYYECIVSYGVNWLSFLAIAWPFHTEKYYDFTGMISFLAVDIFSITYNGVKWNADNIRSIVLFFMAMCWTLRLGLFLFKRITGSHGGKDKRFDNLRNNFWRFSVAWCLQATWAYFCMMPLFIVNQVGNRPGNTDNEFQVRRDDVDPWTPLDIVGWALWAFGWFIEILADRQKTAFKNDPNNRGKFCNAGLWSLSRHPNYFGEITLWIGIFISSASVAYNAGWLAVLSPVWTIILLVFSSGIPLAERTSMKKYGDQEEYQKYVKEVSVLIPLPCCWKGYI